MYLKSMQQYDVVVIGAGSAGLTSAVGFAKIGKKVLLVEREHMGGECTNSGCVPSKALLHHAKQYHVAKQVAGDTTTSETFRAEAFQYVRSKIAAILAEETPETFEQQGIDVVMGEATFKGKCSVLVGGTEYDYKTAIIATGSSPRLVDIPGLEENDILTNQNIFTLDDVPTKLLVLGGGPIGLEMAQAFAMLGSSVTVVDTGERFAKLEDAAVATIVEQEFTALGITVHYNSTITNVQNRLATVTNKETGETIAAPFDKLLMAIGRVPNLPSNLEAAGIEYDDRCIMVDKHHRTSNKYVYAVGDVAQRLKFTHTADDIARQIVTRVASKGWLRLNLKKAVPKVTYTKPEMAQVGLSQAEAEAKYGADRIMRIEVPFSANDRAHTESAAGVLVVIVRRLSGTVLGAHIAGPAAGELLAVFTLAIDQKISLWKLRRVIYAYPTYSLVIKKAGDYFFAAQIGDLKQDVLGVVKRNAPKIIAALFWGVVIYSFQHYRISNELSYQDMLFSLIDFFTSTVWGPLVYMVLYAVRPIVLFPATLLTALSGVLFGFWWGVLYTVIGENASANLAYWIGRFFGKDLKLEDSIIGNWVEALRKNSFETVLLMRLFYVPFDLTNYGSGIVRAKWRSYFMATLIGIMPGLVTFVALGAAVDLEEFRTMGLSFDAFDPKFLALSVAIFIGSLFLSKLLKRWKAHA